MSLLFSFSLHIFHLSVFTFLFAFVFVSLFVNRDLKIISLMYRSQIGESSKAGHSLYLVIFIISCLWPKAVSGDYKTPSVRACMRP